MGLIVWVLTDKVAVGVVGILAHERFYESPRKERPVAHGRSGSGNLAMLTGQGTRITDHLQDETAGGVSVIDINYQRPVSIELQ